MPSASGAPRCGQTPAIAKILPASLKMAMVKPLRLICLPLPAGISETRATVVKGISRSSQAITAIVRIEVGRGNEIAPGELRCVQPGCRSVTARQVRGYLLTGTGGGGGGVGGPLPPPIGLSAGFAAGDTGDEDFLSSQPTAPIKNTTGIARSNHFVTNHLGILVNWPLRSGRHERLRASRSNRCN